MPQGSGYRDMLARLSQMVGENSAAREGAISDEFARGLGQDYESMRSNDGNAALTRQEQGTRDLAVRMGTPNSSSFDELKNYAELKRRQREGLPFPASMPGNNVRDSGIPDPDKAELLAELEAGKQRSIAAMNEPPPAVQIAREDPEKARLMQELEAAGNKTSAEIGALDFTRAPGTKGALSAELDKRRQEILARLASSVAPMPVPQAPSSMTPTPAAAPALPQQAPAPPMAPIPVQPPVATFPLIPPVVYPPSPAYPVPAQPNLQALDQAARQNQAFTDYARFRAGR